MKTNLIKHVFLIVFLVTYSFSCTERREDHSRSVEDYMTLGMPDPDSKWTMEDYKLAHNVLAKIKWEHPEELPVRDSEKSGALFEHMVSLEYLSFLQDTAMSLNAKAERISEFTRVYEYWIDVYTIPILQENPYQREIMDLQVFNLRLMEAMLNLAHKINKSEDPADVALQYGYESIRQNYLTSLSTGLKTQRRTSGLPDHEMEWMADSIYASISRNREWMDPGMRSELSQSLHSVIDSSKSDYIRNKYRTLEESLRGT
ncbi:MAG TPA: hypothetical protein VKZ75_01470 [Cyclobacteriaceae bacterium]|nr:hypothetical protein [Cyclobacteriaceae bacterium]